MASKHTQGPWEITVGSRNQQFIKGPYESDRKYIARIHPMGSGVAYHDGDADEAPSAEAKANARLIAAAPELLEIAERFKRTIEFMIRVDEKNGDDEGANLKRVTLTEVNATLAKARGEG